MPTKRLNLFFISLLCLFFLWIALYELGGKFPPGLNHDGSWNTLYAIRILNGDPLTKTPYAPEAYGRETLYHYTLAGFLKLFGFKKETIEIAGAFFGLLSVLCFYLSLNNLAKNKTYSFLFTLMWSSSSALIVYARSGWRLITLIPAVVLLILIISSYTFKRSRLSALGIGLASGIILYTYNGGRLIPIFLFLFWLVTLINSKKKKAVFFDSLVSFLSFLLVSLPMISFALKNWVLFNSRATTLGENNSLTMLIENVKTSLLFYNRAGNGGDFITNFPALEGPVSIFWILGILIALIRLNKYWVFLLLFMVFLIPGILTSPSFHRAVGTLPLVYFFSFFFLLEVFAFSKSRLARTKLVVLISIVFIQVFYSVNKLYIEKKPFLNGFYPAATAVGQYIKEKSLENPVIYAGNWPKDILTFLTIEDYSAYKTYTEIPNNYQNYNTTSHGGTEELILDLKEGKISTNSTFIVDLDKNNLFVAAIENQGFRIQQVADVIRLESGNPVANVYKIVRPVNW